MTHTLPAHPNTSIPRFLDTAAAIWFAAISVFTSALFLALYFRQSDTEVCEIYGAMAAVSLLIAALWTRHDPAAHVRRMELLHQIIRMGLAHVVLWYGLAKLMPSGGQFGHPPLIVAELPYYDLPPFWKAFAFFGYSGLYNAAMAAGEIVSAVFIYFDRTRRLGLCLLVLIMSNIALVNYAFDIGILMLAVQLLITALYLLCADMPALAAFFWSGAPVPARSPASLTPTVRRAVTLAKLAFALVIVASQVYLFRQAAAQPPRPPVYGIWQSTPPATTDSAAPPATAWAKVYFDECLYLDEPPAGNLRTVDGSVQEMHYTVDPATRHITITVESPERQVLEASYALQDDGSHLSLTFKDGSRVDLRKIH